MSQANGVQFEPEGLDVRVAQMGVRSDVGDCQWMSWSIRPCKRGSGLL